MKSYLLILLGIPLLLLALPNATLPFSAGPSAAQPKNCSCVIGATVSDPDGAVRVELQHTCKNSSSTIAKNCQKKKCLKHPKAENSQNGAIPVWECEQSLYALLNQQEQRSFSTPDAACENIVIHAFALPCADLKKDPDPPRFS